MPIYLWRDAQGCEFNYEDYPAFLGHLLKAKHNDGALWDGDSGDLVVTSSQRALKKWREGTLLPDKEPQEYQTVSEKRREATAAKAAARAKEVLQEEPAHNRRRGRPPGSRTNDGLEPAATKVAFRPVVHDIDPILGVMYDITKSKFRAEGYEYTKSFPDWLREVVVRYYADNAEAFGILHLFTEDEQDILSRGLDAQLKERAGVGASVEAALESPESPVFPGGNNGTQGSG